MNLKEAVAKMSSLRGKIAVVGYLQSQLEDFLPNDTGHRVKEQLKSSPTSQEIVSDDSVNDVLEILDELCASFQKELNTIEQMEISDVRKTKDKRPAVG